MKTDFKSAIAAPALVASILVAGCSMPTLAPIDDAVESGSLVDDFAVEQRPEDVEDNATKDTAFAAREDSSLKSSGNRSDLSWGAIYVKADVRGIHYNINQPAKSADALADDWSLVFAPEAPFRGEDTIEFCGPTASFTVQLLDVDSQKLLYEGKVEGVAPCER